MYAIQLFYHIEQSTIFLFFYQFSMITSNFGKDDADKKSLQDLKLIFAYYCKLNNQKAKHKVFQDFSQKSQTMSLHEFMTFCKNFQITAKQHKRTDHNILSQFLQSKREKKNVSSNEFIKKNDGQKYQSELRELINQRTQIIQDEKFKRIGDIVQNQFSKPHDKQIHAELLAQKHIKIPSIYLNQKKIAQIFKKEASPLDEINFEIFLNIIQSISQQMFPKIYPKTIENNLKQSKVEAKNKELLTQTKQTKESCLTDLLIFLNLDSKFHIIETFIKINQLHGNKQHLALMRSPIKKLHLKNDPLGKYAKKQENNKQNNLRSRLNHTENFPQKLPRVVKPNLKKQLLTYAKNDIKSITNQQLTVFMRANRSQIEHLNKCYLKNIGNLVSQESTKRDSSMEYLDPNTSKNYSTVINQKSTKKYSQRHKDKVIGDINHKEIGKLIDISSLYEDQIFNKYAQLNFKKNNQIK